MILNPTWAEITDNFKRLVHNHKENIKRRRCLNLDTWHAVFRKGEAVDEVIFNIT